MKNAYLQLRILSALLTLQFLLGVILSTLIDYDPKHRTAVQIVFLVLHIVVAVFLSAASVYRLVTAFSWGFLRLHSGIGFISVLTALISGGISAANANKVAVFMMALGFLAAFGAYGYSMSAISRKS